MMLGRKLAAVCFGCALVVTPAIAFAEGPSSLELQFRNHLLGVQGAASGQEAGAAGDKAGLFASGSFAQISAAVLAAAALALAISALTGGDSGTTTTTSSSTSTSTVTATTTSTRTGNDLGRAGL
jgi:hypothetical protein